MFHLGRESEEAKQEMMSPKDSEAKPYFLFGKEGMKIGGGGGAALEGGNGKASPEVRPEEGEQHSAETTETGAVGKEGVSESSEVKDESEGRNDGNDETSETIAIEEKSGSPQTGPDGEAENGGDTSEETGVSVDTTENEQTQGGERSSAGENQNGSIEDVPPQEANGKETTPETSQQSDPVHEPTAESKAGTFTLERLHATRAAAQSLIDNIESYYYGQDTTEKMMQHSWLAQWDFTAPNNGTQEGDLVYKLVDTMARALVTEDQEEFIIGTIGSSVAAGHDNW